MSPSERQMNDIERKMASAKPVKFVDKSTRQIASNIAREIRDESQKPKKK